ncbi:MAG: hypothetical protein J6B72_02710 [Clostridia bacterium]|nr:hypothetical protein [Clostridia bacterium]
MSNKKRKKRPAAVENTAAVSKMDKKTAARNVCRLLITIAVTMVIFCLYRYLINFYYFEIVLGIYMAVATVVIFTYVIYNRGFSRMGLTPEMLPDTMTEEEKAEFIEDGKQRLRKSRPLLILIFAFAFTFIFDILELFALPLVKELLGI